MNFLITGASRGIGLHLTQFALENGHTVFAFVRDPSSSRYLYSESKTYGEKLKIIKCDVTLESDLLAAKDQMGDVTIDVLVNNAGIFSDYGLKDVTAEDLATVFSVDVISPILMTQTFLNQLQKSPEPKLINITSLMGSIADNKAGGYYSYRIAKAGLNMFSKCFSIDFPQITCLTLHPGWVRTDMGGADAPLLPRESARGLFKMITEAKNSQTGKFFDYSGKELPW